MGKKSLNVSCFLGITPLTNAEVVLDGSLGVAGSLPGPNFQIDAGLGQQLGSNLFHSFDRFNLTKISFKNPTLWLSVGIDFRLVQ